jgi:hypothetical protein
VPGEAIYSARRLSLALPLVFGNDVRGIDRPTDRAVLQVRREDGAIALAIDSRTRHR